MKAITLTQPWATLVAIGAKCIETRGWSTPHRGQLAIHAAKSFASLGGEANYLAFCRANAFVYAALHRAGLVPRQWSADALLALPRGAVVAVSTLASVVPVTALPWQHGTFAIDATDDHPAHTWPLTEQEYTFGNYTAGRFAFLFSDVQALQRPLAVRGTLGIWEWDILQSS